MTEINIREATVNDLEAIAKIHVDAWRHNYIDIVPQAVLDRMSYDIQEEKWTERLFTNNLENERMYVLEVENEIKGFSSGVIIDETKALINAIYFAPSAQRKGYGTQLFRYMRRTLNRKTVELWCFKENESRMFYESLGGKIRNESSRQLEEKIVKEVQYIFGDI